MVSSLYKTIAVVLFFVAGDLSAKAIAEFFSTRNAAVPILIQKIVWGNGCGDDEYGYESSTSKYPGYPLIQGYQILGGGMTSKTLKIEWSGSKMCTLDSIRYLAYNPVDNQYYAYEYHYNQYNKVDSENDERLLYVIDWDPVTGKTVASGKIHTGFATIAGAANENIISRLPTYTEYNAVELAPGSGRK